MGRRATPDTGLASRLKMAIPVCKQAEREGPRTGPGRQKETSDRG